MTVRISPQDRPRLVRRARLQLDELTGSYVLLSPERGLVLNGSAAAIVERCCGEQTIEQIVQQVAGGSDRTNALSDTLELLAALHARRLLTLEPEESP